MRALSMDLVRGWLLDGFGLAALTARRREQLDLDSVSKPGKVTVVDGYPVHYEEYGDGPPLVLLHGFGGSSASFRHNFEELSERFRVLAPDLKGFGYSSRSSEGGFTLGSQARLVAGFMDALGVREAAVVGHSMGGGVAMRLAVAQPDRVTGLILAASIVDPVRSGGRVALLQLAAPLVYLLTNRWTTKRLLKRLVADPALISDEVAEIYYRPMRVRGTWQARKAMARAAANEAPIPFDRIGAPATVVAGAKDPLIPLAQQRRLASALPGANLHVLEACGHLVPEERPGEFNRIVIESVSRLAASG